MLTIKSLTWLSELDNSLLKRHARGMRHLFFPFCRYS